MPIHTKDLQRRIMSKHAGLLLIFLFLTTALWSQKYNYTAGVRIGTEFGGTVAARIGKKATLEGLGQYSHFYNSSRIAVLLRQHQGLLGKRFNIYIGGGPGWSWYHSEDQDIKDEQSLNVLAIFGVEGTIGRLNISWDYKPVYAFAGPRTFSSETALSLRYVIIKRKWRPFKKKKEPFWQRIF